MSKSNYVKLESVQILHKITRLACRQEVVYIWSVAVSSNMNQNHFLSIKKPHLIIICPKSLKKLAKSKIM